ncbi:MAG: BON domain-containing protein [Pseudoxanthomonas sp.]|nr:BON domain-containing protein [Pseudoxanthomonas sp.]
MSYRSESERNGTRAPRGNREQGRHPAGTSGRDWDEERQDFGGRGSEERGGYGTSTAWNMQQGYGARSSEDGGSYRGDSGDDYRQGRGGYARQGFGDGDATSAESRGHRPPQFGYGRGGPERDEYGDAGYARGEYAADEQRWTGQGGAEGDYGLDSGDYGRGQRYMRGDLRRAAPRYGGQDAGWRGQRDYDRGREYGGSYGSHRDMGQDIGAGGGSYGAAREAYAQDARGTGGGERQGASFRGHGPRNYTRSDARITEDLNERLTDDPSFDAGGIEVSVKDGVATLSGSVDSRWMKHRAEDIAEACSGVKDVDNRIRVSSSGGGAGLWGSSGRGTGTNVGDGGAAGTTDTDTARTVGPQGRTA